MRFECGMRTLCMEEVEEEAREEEEEEEEEAKDEEEEMTMGEMQRERRSSRCSVRE